MRGALYVAFGETARREASASIKCLRDLPVCVIGDEPLIGNELSFVPFDEPGPGARRAKLNMDLLTPFEQTLYLDADTRPRGDVTPGFDILGDGWHIVLAHSGRQGYDVIGNVENKERLTTFDEIGNAEPLGLQCGVIFFRRCEEVARLFKAWREEWERFRDQDQGAFLRALVRCPVKVWLLGLPYNSEYGEIVEHKFGRAKL